MDRIVIVGGGTSGWMAAIAISSHLPHVHVTVIEPSAMGPIGVGESVTGVVQRFVAHPPHKLDVGEFYRQSDATLKLGIWYRNWLPGGGEYLTPIDSPALLFEHRYPQDVEDLFAMAAAEGHKLGEYQIHGKLMRAGCTDYFREPGGAITSRLSMASCHFDALKFSAWLRQQCGKRSNITHVDDVVTGFDQDPETGLIRSVRTEKGVGIPGDFFVDCSGLRRVLLAKAYAPKWIDYSAYLRVDSAIPNPEPHDDEQPIPVYTGATAMPHGWMWQVPTQSRLGRGYVFSSRYVSDEQAVADAKAAGLSLGDRPPVIRFKPGKFEWIWKGNVCALGMAGGFLEPLEATTIHVIYVQIKALTELFLPNYTPAAAAPLASHYNQLMDVMYNDFVDFISFHYHTGRNDTEFWRDYQKETSITDANRARREKWKHAFPVREDFPGMLSERFFLTTGIVVWMPMLSGMGLLDAASARRWLNASKHLPQARLNAQRYTAARDLIAATAVSQREAIAHLRG